MIFGEEVEVDAENLTVYYDQYIAAMLGRVSKTETSKLDIIGMCSSNFPTDKTQLWNQRDTKIRIIEAEPDKLRLQQFFEGMRKFIS